MKKKIVLIIIATIGIILIVIGIYSIVKKTNDKYKDKPILIEYIPDEIEENNGDVLSGLHEYNNLSFSGATIIHNLKTKKYELYINITNNDTKDLINKKYILTFYDSNGKFIDTKTIKIDYIEKQSSYPYHTEVNSKVFNSYDYKIRIKP